MSWYARLSRCICTTIPVKFSERMRGGAPASSIARTCICLALSATEADLWGHEFKRDGETLCDLPFRLSGRRSSPARLIRKGATVRTMPFIAGNSIQLLTVHSTGAAPIDEKPSANIDPTYEDARPRGRSGLARARRTTLPERPSYRLPSNMSLTINKYWSE